MRITMVQLPAMNTPQFSWVISRLPKDPQPVPPIYQPELAARAVLWAADHDRREWWVGASTAATLAANAVVPGLLDRYLARTGVRSQQTAQRITTDPVGNLWRPADQHRDHGAHGLFGSHAHPRSAQWWLTSHRRSMAALASAAVAAGLWGRRTRRR